MNIMLQMSKVFIHLIEVQIEIGFNGIHASVEVGFHQTHAIKHVSNPRRFTIKGLSALLRDAFTPSSLSCWLRLNLFFLFFTFIVIFFNFFEKSFHILIVTKVMLLNLIFIQRSKLFWVFDEKIIKKHWFGRRKRTKVNPKELSYLSNNTTNTNCTNKTITNEP